MEEITVLVYWSQLRTVKDRYRRAQSLQTTYNYNPHSQPQHVGLISIFTARMDYQWDFTFSGDIEGCLWSRQSTCGERTEQRRVRPHASRADVFSFFYLSFHLFQGSVLICLQTWFNAREWIFLWGQIWDMWHWIIDGFLRCLYNETLQMKGLYKSLPNFSATSFVRGCHFWFGVMHTGGHI